MSCVDETISVKEGAFGVHTFQLVDEDGNNVSLAAINTGTLTLFDVVTGAIINSRNAQDVLNVNGVTISATGAVEWTMVEDDCRILSSIKREEHHHAHFRFAWDSSTKHLSFLIEIRVCDIGQFAVSA